MLNTSLHQCPYEDWEKAARSSCSPSERFHCLTDEFERFGWLCIDPIWIESGRCPVYNSGAKKLDSTTCNEDNCPLKNYRSNEVYIKKACQWHIPLSGEKNETEGSNSPGNDVSEASHLKYYVAVSLIVPLLLFLTVVVVIVIVKRKRSTHQKLHTRDPEELHVITIDPEELPITDPKALPTKDPEELSTTDPKALPTIDPEELSTTDPKALPTTDPEEESVGLFLKGTSSETISIALHRLETKHFVVLKGITGSGKTYLAKHLVENIKGMSKTKNKFQIQWIHDTVEVKLLSLKSKATILILDDIFYELQSKEDVCTAITKVEDLFLKVNGSNSLFVVVTIPSYIWNKHYETFNEKTFSYLNVNLDTLNKAEREDILNTHLKLNRIKVEENAVIGELYMRNRVKSSIINTDRCDFIGYPSCIAWICKTRNQLDLNEADRFFLSPITRLKTEIHRLRDSANLKERKMFLLLAITALSDGTLNVENINKGMLQCLARIYFPKDDVTEFDVKNDDTSLFSLEEKYIRKESVGSYEIQQDVVRKLVFVIAMGKNIEAIREHVSKNLWKRFIVQRDKFPRDMVGEYSNFFLKL